MACSVLGTSAWAAGKSLMCASCSGFGAAHVSPLGTGPNPSANSCTPAALGVGENLAFVAAWPEGA